MKIFYAKNVRVYLLIRIYIYIYIYIYIHFGGVRGAMVIVALSARAVEYIDCISAKGRDFLTECLEYDTKQSDGEAPVMLELWRMRGTFSLPSVPYPLWRQSGST